MKTFVLSVRALSLLVVFALARIILLTPVNSLATLVALALAAAGTLLAFAGWDYARKPSFRVRRTPAPIDTAAREIRPAINPAIEWTYAPRTT